MNIYKLFHWWTWFNGLFGNHEYVNVMKSLHACMISWYYGMNFLIDNNETNDIACDCNGHGARNKLFR